MTIVVLPSKNKKPVGFYLNDVNGNLIDYTPKYIYKMISSGEFSEYGIKSKVKIRDYYGTVYTQYMYKDEPCDIVIFEHTDKFNCNVENNLYYPLTIKNKMLIHIFDKHSPDCFITVEDEIYRSLGETKKEAMERIATYWKQEVSLEKLINNTNIKHQMDKQVLDGKVLVEITKKIRETVDIGMTKVANAVKQAAIDTKSLDKDTIYNEALRIAKVIESFKPVKFDSLVRKVFDVKDDLGNVFLFSILAYKDYFFKEKLVEDTIQRIKDVIKLNSDGIVDLNSLRLSDTDDNGTMVEDEIANLHSLLNGYFSLEDLKKVTIPYMLVQGKEVRKEANKQFFTSTLNLNGDSAASALFFHENEISEQSKKCTEHILRHICKYKPLEYKESDILNTIKEVVKEKAEKIYDKNLKMANSTYDLFMYNATLENQKIITDIDSEELTCSNYLRKHNIGISYFIRL
jgi:hypothetical protein